MVSHDDSKSSDHHDHELRNLGRVLRWCALDHSSWAATFISYSTFVLLAIIVPFFMITSFDVHHVPDDHAADDNEGSIRKLVQVAESLLASISFFTLSSVNSHGGLRQLLFLDALHEERLHVRRAYTRHLHKAFRSLASILVPSFVVKLADKIVFFKTIDRVSKIIAFPIPVDLSVLASSAMVSWVYRTGAFLLVCVLFRVTCEFQILRFEGFHELLESEGCGSDVAGLIFDEHMRIRRQLSTISHRFRFFIIACLVTITVSQLGALWLIFQAKSPKTFFNSGDLLVCSAVEIGGFFMCIMGAARITHRAQGIVSVVTRWHMVATRASISDDALHQQKVATTLADTGHDLYDSQQTSQNPFSFHARQALG
ncbi:hypothetical protein NMG60_11025920 [Bertholletia excelsa]